MCLLWQRRKSEAPQHEDEVFELLFSHMALNLFTEPDQAIDILKVTRQKVLKCKTCSTMHQNGVLFVC